MKSDEIRNRILEKATWTSSDSTPLQLRDCASFLRELAAQVAEAVDQLKALNDPPFTVTEAEKVWPQFHVEGRPLTINPDEVSNVHVMEEAPSILHLDDEGKMRVRVVLKNGDSYVIHGDFNTICKKLSIKVEG